MLHLKLFGGFDLRDESGCVRKPVARKDAALLAYLLLRGRPCERSVLADLLWPDRSEAQARKSLRQALVALRRLLNLGEEALPANRESTVAINPGLISVDVLEFEAQAVAAAPDVAIALHDGTLLEGFDGLSAPFDDWLATERMRMDDLAAQMLVQRCRQCLEAADWAAALSDARRLVAVEPLREDGHRLLMRALDCAGHRAEALQQFHRFCGILREELDVSPDPETAALYHEIRDRPAVSATASPMLTADRGSPLAPVRRPGLIVLPFCTTCEPADARCFADGLHEEMITTLAQYRWFFVISRLQSSMYQGRSATLSQLGAELGVRYVLSGTLSRQGRRACLALELVLAESGEHLWSGKFETYADEAVDAQDETAREIAAQIEPELVNAEVDIALRTPERKFDAWSLLMRARQQADTCRPDAIRQALDLTDRALRLAPESSLGHATHAYSCWLDYLLVGADRSRLDVGIAAAERAVAIDPRFYLGHSALGSSLSQLRRYEPATKSLRRAIDTNPSFPVAYNQLTSCLTLVGRPGEALEWVARLREISPNDPLRGFYGCIRATAYYFLGDNPAAIENAELSVAEHPGWLQSEVLLAAAYHRTGRLADAWKVAERILAKNKPLDRAGVYDIFRPRRDADLSSIVDPLAAMGIVA